MEMQSTHDKWANRFPWTSGDTVTTHTSEPDRKMTPRCKVESGHSRIPRHNYLALDVPEPYTDIR
eukprot:scaffold271387_cov12-Tisochrysis_lutea.AAC.1